LTWPIGRGNPSSSAIGRLGMLVGFRRLGMLVGFRRLGMLVGFSRPVFAGSFSWWMAAKPPLFSRLQPGLRIRAPEARRYAP